MRRVKEILKSEKGSGVAQVIAAAAFILFIILPLFSVVIERYILYNKINIIKDAIDLSNLSIYNTISTEKTSKGHDKIDFNSNEMTIYKRILAKNLNLNADMTPKEKSIAESTVEVVELKAYLYASIPTTCTQGNTLDQPTIHAVIKVPVKPTLLSNAILSALGKDYIDIKIHVDTEIPINN